MIDLADVIRDLRESLETAMAAAPEDGLRFALGPVELQLSVVVEKNAKVGGKVRFWVVDSSAEGSLGSAQTQHVKLTLTPAVGPDGKSVFVGGEAQRKER